MLIENEVIYTIDDTCNFIILTIDSLTKIISIKVYLDLTRTNRLAYEKIQDMKIMTSG